VLALLLLSCGQKTKYPVHQIPKGYEGFVVAVLNQPGFPELPTNRKNQFLHYPSDGISITSSSQLFGISADQAIETTSKVDQAEQKILRLSNRGEPQR
jgi:hypothetical protein